MQSEKIFWAQPDVKMCEIVDYNLIIQRGMGGRESDRHPHFHLESVSCLSQLSLFTLLARIKYLVVDAGGQSGNVR